MGRCCSLSTRSTCRDPQPTAPTAAVHLLYPIPYASIYIQYILLPPPTCFSVPTLLTPVTVTLWAHCLPTKLFLYVSCCIYHMMFVYILFTSTKCMLCTTLVVSLPLLPHNPSPSPLPLLPADLKQMGPPLCAMVLIKVPSWLTGSFSFPLLPLCLH